jgi:hypothetical protein
MASKFPAEIGACIDLLYATRTRRLDIERKAEKATEPLKKAEKELEEHIIGSFKKSEIDGAKGKKATAGIKQATVASVKDWDEFFVYVAKTKAWDMLQKRVNNAAYRERLEAKKVVPGVEPFVATSLSVTRR